MSKNHEKPADKNIENESCKDEKLKKQNSAVNDEQCCKTSSSDNKTEEKNEGEHCEKLSDNESKKKDETISPEKAALEEAQKKITELEANCKDWQEQYLRKAADFENYRKRMLREKQEAIDYANSNLLLDLVQVLDDFDRAIEAGKNQADNAFTEGVIMIKNQMVSMLSSKYGLSYYPAKGEKFDPNIHEAVSMIQSEDVKEPVIGEEIQKGYKLKDRIIRSSKVMVLMPAEKQAENKSDTDEKNTSESEGANNSDIIMNQ